MIDLHFVYPFIADSESLRSTKSLHSACKAALLLSRNGPHIPYSRYITALVKIRRIRTVPEYCISISTHYRQHPPQTEAHQKASTGRESTSRVSTILRAQWRCSTAPSSSSSSRAAHPGRRSRNSRRRVSSNGSRQQPSRLAHTHLTFYFR